MRSESSRTEIVLSSSPLGGGGHASSLSSDGSASDAVSASGCDVVQVQVQVRVGLGRCLGLGRRLGLGLGRLGLGLGRLGLGLGRRLGLGLGRRPAPRARARRPAAWAPGQNGRVQLRDRLQRDGDPGDQRIQTPREPGQGAAIVPTSWPCNTSREGRRAIERTSSALSTAPFSRPPLNSSRLS